MSVTQRTVQVNDLCLQEFVVRNHSMGEGAGAGGGGGVTLSLLDLGATLTSCLLHDCMGHCDDPGDTEKGSSGGSSGRSSGRSSGGGGGGGSQSRSLAGEEVALCFPLERLARAEYAGPYFGATVGRVCNRICEGKFLLKGEDGQVKECKLAVNNGVNHLHGGMVGFDKKIWDSEVVESDDTIGVKFSCESPDGEEGYPGNVKVEATYVLSRKSNDIIITFNAISDALTPINLTNHTYWNLSGDFSRDARAHSLYLNCDRYLPVTATQIPTGEFADVNGTLFDFTAESSNLVSTNMPIPPLPGDNVGVITDSVEMQDNAESELTEITLTPEELANESDADFIARMEREEAAAFAKAVESWRKDRACGKGKAVIIESGGDFARCKDGKDIVPCKVLGDVIDHIDGGGKEGIDHCFMVNQYHHPGYEQPNQGKDESVMTDEFMQIAAVLHDPTSGRRMVCSTTQPGVQVYTANWLPPAGNDDPFRQHNAVCLETQGLPDAVNQLNFPSVLLHPSNKYVHKTKYSFYMTK